MLTVLRFNVAKNARVQINLGSIGNQLARILYGVHIHQSDHNEEVTSVVSMGPLPTSNNLSQSLHIRARDNGS